MTDAIDLAEKLSRFSERWAPKILARMNDHLSECCATIVEAAGTANTGDAGGDMTALSDARI